MYLPPDSVIEDRLIRTFPEDELRELARATDLVQREGGKLDAAALFFALALGFAVGEDRSLEAFRQRYLQNVGGSLAYASFHDWFVPALCEFLREILDRAIEDLSTSSDQLRGRLDGFRDVLLVDMTVVTLYQSLTDEFPGYGDDHAGAKLHVVESVSTGLPTQFSITDARTNESTELSTGGWIAGALLIYDQGYFDYRTMDLIESNGGWFVTRLKSNANPLIVEELRRWRGDAISLTDRKLHDVLDDLHRDVIDVRVEVSFKRRRYQGSRSRATRTFRVVGIRNEETEKYHLYITNLPVSDYRAPDIAKLYQARWEVELLFKELKSTFNLDEVSSSKPEVVEALILIAVLSLVVSRALRQLFVEIVAYNQDSDDDREPSSLLPRRRWSKVFSRYSAEILRRVAKRLGYESPHLVGLIYRDALDPNQHRPSLLEDVQYGEFVRELA
ncbi:IS4 family transposase [Natrinema soli]|uniref:IS4 family transposase n=1 Tax=Natrinema soli TaxID=1930624 RepID=A0ABD5SME7_9EURY